MAVASYRPQYTVEDYLRWEGDWELWDGIPVARSPSPGFFHQTIAGELFSRIKALLGNSSCPADCRAVLDPDDRSALLLSFDRDGSYRELPPEDPFEIHPGCVLQLEIAPLFV